MTDETWEIKDCELCGRKCEGSCEKKLEDELIGVELDVESKLNERFVSLPDVPEGTPGWDRN